MSRRVVFFGRNGRLSTRPLEAIHQRLELVGVVEGDWTAPGPWWGHWLGGQPMAGNLERFSRAYGLPHLKVKSGRDPSLKPFLHQLRAEVMALANFPFRLPPTVLDLCPGVNLHPSLLPLYRGVYPWLWQFYHQETEGGWTAHLLDEGLDRGPILAQQPFPIPFGVTASELIDQVLQPGADLLAQVLCEQPLPTPQDPAPGARRAPLVQPGQKLVKWSSWPVERVYHFLRGAPPWHEELGLRPGFRWRAIGFSKTPSGQPGRILASRQGWALACLDGTVALSLEPQSRELARLGATLTGLGAAALWLMQASQVGCQT